MNEHHDVRDISVSDGVLSAVVDGTPMSANLRDLSPALATASNEDLAFLEISPSGYGIHWPRIDEDISIDGLLGVAHQPSFMKQSA